jgi:acyl-CoA synthetase (AMP-forming)/AMP-acid ligase II
MVTANQGSAAPVVEAFYTGDLEKGKARPAGHGEGPLRDLVGCGRVVGEQRVFIVDPDRLEPLPDGAIGEIWVAGPSVAQGYWRLLKETEATFGAVLAGVEWGPLPADGRPGRLPERAAFSSRDGARTSSSSKGRTTTRKISS